MNGDLIHLNVVSALSVELISVARVILWYTSNELCENMQL